MYSSVDIFVMANFHFSFWLLFLWMILPLLAELNVSHSFMEYYLCVIITTGALLQERINVRYISKINGQAAEVELPLSLLVTGDLKGRPDDTPLDERQPVAIDKNTFNAVLAQSGIERNVSVPSVLNGASGARMDVSLKVKSMADLSPDNIAAQVPELKKMLELREALVALKGPMGNIPAFRAQLQALLDNEETREQLIQELGLASGK